MEKIYIYIKYIPYDQWFEIIKDCKQALNFDELYTSLDSDEYYKAKIQRWTKVIGQLLIPKVFVHVNELNEWLTSILMAPIIFTCPQCKDQTHPFSHARKP